MSTQIILSFQLAIITIYCTQLAIAECPRLCECKWKSGKESVLCLNANLSSIPTHLDAGTQVLDLTSNHLVSVKHDEFGSAGLLNLQKVYISKCRLKNLERYAFRRLNNLVELDLSYNSLNNIPSHTFDSVPELRELKLNGNPIQRILNDAFLNVAQLIRLELSDCRIVNIEPRAFRGLELSLEWLKLDKNRLQEVNAKSFMGLENLHGLELAANMWNCSCALRPLRGWMLKQNVPFDIPPQCHTPKRLQFKSWDKLDLDEFACVPEIFAFESQTRCVEGKNVTMTCRIEGIPEPSVRWLLKNRVIANLSSSGKKLYTVHLQNFSSDLTIFSADLQDAGVYVCAAENKAGKAEASVTLAVIKKPPDGQLTSKILIASVITGIVLVLASCLIALCVYSVRKKQVIRWQTRDCRSREDNYEKIEMNHKVSGNNLNSNGGPVQVQEVAVVSGRKNGDYRVVPVVDSEEVEDEEDDGDCKIGLGDRRWNSPEHLLDPEDLHIPRRTLQEARGDIKKAPSSMCGTYNPPPPPLPSTSTRRQLPSIGAYATTYNTELSSLAEDENNKNKYPDLIENSSSSYKSLTDITEIFCTLPHKRTLIQSSRYRSSDSQSPLLPESRCGSSGGDSQTGSQELGLRRMSDCPNRKFSNSYLNLTREETPLLDVSNLESHVSGGGANFKHMSGQFNKQKELSGDNIKMSPNSVQVTPNSNSCYDYHAAQLERFLEEYRTLQKQLTKMKETCDNLRQDHLLPSTSSDEVLRNNTVSPNSNRSLEDSIDFRNFESELTKYLLAKKSFGAASNSGGVFNN